MVSFPGSEAAAFYILSDEYLQEENILKLCRSYLALFNRLFSLM